MQNVAILVAMFALVLVVNLVKGGGAFSSPLGIRCGSFGFWMAEAGIVAATILVCAYARRYLLRQGRRKRAVAYPFLETDICWDERTTVLYPALCTFAGIVAGLFGIGGGLVKAPLLLALGVHPAVASATSATMILFTTFTATTSFWVYGVLLMDYAVVGLVVGFVATLVGQTLMNLLLRRTGRNSYIAFCIAAVVLVSAVTMTIEWIVALGNGGRGQSGEGICSSHVNR